MDGKYAYDIVVIGAGPGGYVTAIRASQLGFKVAVIEKDKPGGVCLNIGCIPSKALIHQADVFMSISELEYMGVKIDLSQFDYSKVFQKSRIAADKLSKGVEYLIRKHHIELIKGVATITGQHEITVDGVKKITSENIVIATGSRPREIPGFEMDEETVISSTGALMQQKLPRKILVLGSGAIGIEFAHVMNAFGTEVHVVEMLDRILPIEDEEIADVLCKEFKKRGIRFSTATKATSMKRKNGKIEVTLVDSDGNTTVEVTDKILVSVGRVPNTENIGLENIGLHTEKGFIPIHDYYRTRISNIFAIGDVTNTPALAHVASKEGEIVVEHLAGLSPDTRIDPNTIPNAVYCEPQIASFGYKEWQAKQEGISYKKATFPYRGAGKSVAIEHPEGMVKILFDPETKEILGCHVVGVDATELIHELLLAKMSELLPEDIATMIHAHPTLSESIMEAMREVEGWAIHA